MKGTQHPCHVWISLSFGSTFYIHNVWPMTTFELLRSLLKLYWLCKVSQEQRKVLGEGGKEEGGKKKPSFSYFEWMAERNLGKKIKERSKHKAESRTCREAKTQQKLQWLESPKAEQSPQPTDCSPFPVLCRKGKGKHHPQCSWGHGSCPCLRLKTCPSTLKLQTACLYHNLLDISVTSVMP